MTRGETDSGTLRVVLVDDEPLVRRELRRALEGLGGVRVVAEAENGAEAVRTVERENPDVVMLDVRMPGMDGFEVLDALEVEPLPAVIFVTAFDEYALRAFEVHAVDYLLKPFDEERVEQALGRARSRLRKESPALDPERLRDLLGALEAVRGGVKRIPVRSAGKISFVDVNEVRWIEASGNYVRLHTAEDSHLVRHTLKELARRLRDRGFVRIHRSVLVDVDLVREIRPKPSGDATVILNDGEELPVSRSYRQEFEDVMTGRG